MRALEIDRRCPACDSPIADPTASECPVCSRVFGSSVVTPAEPAFLSAPQMRYQNAYVWLVLVSALDIILTMLVLYLWDGREVNPITAAVINAMGFVWAIVFKFCTMVFVIIMCEVVGRRDDHDGKTLAVGAVIISAIPVAYTFFLLTQAGPALS